MICFVAADSACDVLYTDLMSPMFPDDNTNSLMLNSAASKRPADVRFHLIMRSHSKLSACHTGETSAVVNSQVSPASPEPVATLEVKQTPDKSELAALDASKAAATGKATDLPAAEADGHTQASTDKTAAPQAETDSQAGAANPRDRAGGMEVDVAKDESQLDEPDAVPAAAEEPAEAVVAAADEVVEAETADVATNSEALIVNEQPTVEPVLSRIEDKAAAAEPMGEEEDEQAELMETDPAQEVEEAKDAQQAKQEAPHQSRGGFSADRTQEGGCTG